MDHGPLVDDEDAELIDEDDEDEDEDDEDEDEDDDDDELELDDDVLSTLTKQLSLSRFLRQTFKVHCNVPP